MKPSIKISVDTSELKKAIEEANQLLLLLNKVSEAIDSLSRINYQNPKDFSIASIDAVSSISCHVSKSELD